MSFGYSVGDLIAGANLTYKLIRIMADTKGASEEYLQAISEVSAMQQAFLQVGQIRAHKLLPPATVNATSHIVLSSVDTITAFLEKSRNYHAVLENRHAAGLQTSWYKVGWTLYKSQELIELRDALRSRLVSVQTLLSSASYAAPLPSSIAPYRVVDEDSASAPTSPPAPALASDDGSERGSTPNTNPSSSLDGDGDWPKGTEPTARNKQQKATEAQDDRHKVADALTNEQNYEGAEAIYRQMLVMQRQRTGPTKVWSLQVESKLGEVLLKQEKYDEAEAIFKAASTIGEDLLGRAHPDTIASIHGQAEALCGQEEYEEAEMKYREALKSKLKTFGKKHPTTLATICRVAETLYQQEKYEEAESLHRENLTAQTLVLGAEHEDTMKTMRNLSDALYQQEKYADAEDVDRELVGLCESTKGKNDAATLLAMRELAAGLRKQAKYEDAERTLLTAVARTRAVLGSAADRNGDMLETMGELAEAIYKQGEHRHEEAESLYRQALEARKQHFGEDDEDTLASMQRLGRLLYDEGRFAEAEPLFGETLRRRKRLVDHNDDGGDDDDDDDDDNRLLLQSMEDHSDVLDRLRAAKSPALEVAGNDRKAIMSAEHEANDTADIIQVAASRAEWQDSDTNSTDTESLSGDTAGARV
ncbi:tetratricopeptide repeat domain-containing protein [Cordyceps javanica]|uniref:Tetratricopeptide repeat domain-containing protein n=1 Tax=Cordyceps javanica TaxID=43265 RepID=A0A545WEC9_9HYPO|nr:tetratricopeptide repeat domain-containing protein [Cordyceps javanica]TQW12341.1 tetratricopeptide repeat domain-containing protein [Cordyceps javanica]